MPIEYLGHKRNLLDFLLSSIRKAEITSKRRRISIADLFCGSAVVSAALKEWGYRVIANDSLLWCSLSAEALLLNTCEPSFQGLHSIFKRHRKNANESPRYDVVLSYLNSLRAKKGFIWRNYSPASEKEAGVARMYFNEKNAARIDAIRRQIGLWNAEGRLTHGENALLLRDLIRSANRCSNVAGTYGCYLKSWKARALVPLSLTRSRLVPGKVDHQIFCDDANAVAARLQTDIVYADPPYTKRQYAAYYHILETIAAGDSPIISGSTGLRPWKHKSSRYCLRRSAPDALAELVSRLACKHFFLSYNQDGQIAHETIMDILTMRGKVSVVETPYRRYKSSRRPHKGSVLTERLYHLRFATN